MEKMMNVIKRLVKEEEGQGTVEYSVVVGVVVVMAIAVIGALKTGIVGSGTDTGIIGDIITAIEAAF